MKKIIALVVVVAGLGVYGGIHFGFFENWGTVTATNEQPQEPEVVVDRYERLTELIDEAVSAARPTLEAEAKEQYEADAAEAKAAYEAALAAAASSSQKHIDDGITAVEDKVKTEYITEIEATISSEDY